MKSKNRRGNHQGFGAHFYSIGQILEPGGIFYNDLFLWRLPLWLLLATSQKMKVSSGYHFLLAIISNFVRWEFLVTLKF